MVINGTFDFFGMKLYFRKDKKFRIEIIQLLIEVVEEFGEYPKTTQTLAWSDLFENYNDLPLADKRRQKLFYRLAYKIFYYTSREIKDLILDTFFLTTRVGKYTKEDYLELRRLVNYIHTTKDKEYLIRIRDIGILYTHINISYTMYVNMRSHSGSLISFKIGLVAYVS